MMTTERSLEKASCLDRAKQTADRGKGEKRRGGEESIRDDGALAVRFDMEGNTKYERVFGLFWCLRCSCKYRYVAVISLLVPDCFEVASTVCLHLQAAAACRHG